jgi:hypothetical protein
MAPSARSPWTRAWLPPDRPGSAAVDRQRQDRRPARHLLLRQGPGTGHRRRHQRPDHALELRPGRASQNQSPGRASCPPSAMRPPRRQGPVVPGEGVWAAGELAGDVADGRRGLGQRCADEDAAAHAAGEDEETARRFGWWPARSTEETVRAAYANWGRNWRDDGPTRAFAARDPETGALVGGCELRIGPDGTGEVSYWTHPGKRGRGHARNALALLLGYAATRHRSASPAWRHTSLPTTTPHGASPSPPDSPRQAPSQTTTAPE